MFAFLFLRLPFVSHVLAILRARNSSARVPNPPPKQAVFVRFVLKSSGMVFSCLFILVDKETDQFHCGLVHLSVQPSQL